MIGRNPANSCRSVDHQKQLKSWRSQRGPASARESEEGRATSAALFLLPCRLPRDSEGLCAAANGGEQTARV
jgi:hypothetical protein